MNIKIQIRKSQIEELATGIDYYRRLAEMVLTLGAIKQACIHQNLTAILLTLANKKQKRTSLKGNTSLSVNINCIGSLHEAYLLDFLQQSNLSEYNRILVKQVIDVGAQKIIELRQISRR